MLPPRPTELAHTLLRDIIREGDITIDATAGNGHDTRFLAELVGASGKVIAYDIQAPAIASTQSLIGDSGFGDRVELHQASHATMANHAEPSSVAAIMFNLGYLPGEDHNITTSTDESLAALKVATTLLQPGGTLSIICYPGHDEGSTEAKAVESWITELAAHHWRIAKYAMLGTKNPAPYLLVATRQS